MTSAARIAMVLAYIRQREAYIADQMRVGERQAEQLLAAETDAERDALVAHWAEVNAPEQVRARAARLARAKRRRQAAERGARTVQPYTVDMSPFEAQWRTSP